MVKKINAQIDKNRINLQPEVKVEKDIDKIESLRTDVLDELVEKTDNPPFSFGNVVKIEFSIKSIIFTLSLILAFMFWEKLMPVIVVFFFAFILASAFKPIVDWLQTKRFSKLAAISVSYVTFILLFLALIAVVIVPFLNEVDSLIKALPSVTTKLLEFATTLEESNIPLISSNAGQIKTIVEDSVKGFSANLLPVLSSSFDGLKVALSTIADVAGGFVTFITAIMLSIYLLNDHDYLIDSFLRKFVGYKRHQIVRKLIEDVEHKLGNWVVGQLSLSLIIGVMSWILLTILGVPFALPLAVLAGIMEAVPSLGPLLSSIPAILFALINGGVNSALYTGLGYVIIQQLENAIIVPKVMGNAVGIRAIYVLTGIIVGFALGGIVGALVAVPILVILKISLEFYFDLQRLKATDKI